MPKTAAERARAYRERERAKKAAEDAAERDARNAVAPTTMRDAVRSALESAKWLTGADAASSAQAHALAKQIDQLEHAGDTVKALSAHRALSQVLNDLGVTATKRQQYELRSRRAEKGGSAGERDEGEGAPAAPENVTAFKRPSKRAR